MNERTNEQIKGRLNDCRWTPLKKRHNKQISDDWVDAEWTKRSCCLFQSDSRRLITFVGWHLLCKQFINYPTALNIYPEDMISQTTRSGLATEQLSSNYDLFQCNVVYATAACVNIPRHCHWQGRPNRYLLTLWFTCAFLQWKRVAQVTRKICRNNSQQSKHSGERTFRDPG